MNQYIDIAVNLVGSALESNAEQVIADAVAVGVSPLILIGSELDESARCIAICQQYPTQLYTTAGVHPHHASSWQSDSADRLREMCQGKVVVAVGECGLDFNRNYSTPAEQRRAFAEQLALAVELQRPVLMHERDAHLEFMAILSEFRAELPAALLHCFTGDIAQAEAYLALDLHLGVTGWVCDERRGQALAEAVTVIPDDRLLLETDSPYLLPRNLKPKPKSSKNEPKYLPHIAHYVAHLRGQPVDVLAAHCYANSLKFFGLE
ncbi:TatD family hydrolase [Shewanella avicenniae]|uniref:TatD family hydrolase n=1 Tax=Shewanella avicenniae TaxID=2814294 RepID=A0ABX7QQV3_9GAMM|nr:TatD family hydrolase [Shewanella avicenniae]QSX33370.1 TatD family hydrolase [Shewanella avicenniae]